MNKVLRLIGDVVIGARKPKFKLQIARFQFVTLLKQPIVSQPDDALSPTYL